MPERLSSVLKGGDWSFSFDPGCLQEKPAIAALTAEAIARWSIIENALAHILIKILGAHAEPGMAMFTALTGAAAQDAALKAAAESILEMEELEAFQVAMQVANSLRKQRNKLAHWLWGSSPQVPNALLLADPDGMIDFYLNVSVRAQGVRAGKLLDMPIEDFLNLYKPDLDRIYIYRAKDVQLIIRDFQELDLILGKLLFILTPLPPHLPTGRERAELFHQLSKLRLYGEALDRLRARQRNNPQAQP